MSYSCDFYTEILKCSTYIQVTHIYVSTEAKGIPKTEIVHGSDNVIDGLVQFMCKAKLRIDVCVDHTRPYLAIEIIRLRESFIDAKRRHVTIRYITEISKDNLRYCKELISLVDELRHLTGIKGNFYVSEQEYAAPSTLHEERKSSEMMIYSNVNEIVEHQQYIFDSFWNTSTSAKRKIREIQSDISLGITEIIDNPLRTRELFINLVKSAKSEVLLILPTINAFMREHRIGIIQLFKELSTTPETTTQRRKSLSALTTSLSEDNHEKEEERRAINIRILTPTNDAIDKIIEEMKKTATISTTSISKEESIFPISSDNDNNPHLKIRHLEAQPEFNVTTVTILVVDRKASLVIEKVDDSKEEFVEAVGLSTYSRSEPTIMSYLSIFENFWNQLELYEKLKEHDKMQEEFINIAAHELRTPTQSILGYAEILEMESEESRHLVNPILRNAMRLQRLTGDILDVTRIESQTLRLNKEEFNLNEMISSVIQDCKSQIDSEKIKLVYEHRSVNNNMIVNADKDRLSQVISNLISNSIKFTQGEWGIISITTKKEQDNKAITISVKDTGKGIDPEIIPRLFTKFATKSETGTGLGLFISKSIVEAHDGKIWAENNADGKGAKFSFSLPIKK
ncbi:MAG TPA: HAMP domain-containing sensor histidine kinase [Candidatus Nitrosopolaris rasttigaisensis]|nr:HAMP domain-containing sensor histidine kinase [Candidatus Nitrosopolaris rasttigaisensis]